MTPRLKFIFIQFLLTIGIFFVFEGIVSVIMALRPIWDYKESRWTKPDPWLGWVNIPNLNKKDFFRKGVGLRTNGLGFRADKDYSAHIPNGKKRIVCLGDSYTFNLDLDNEDTWCRRLELLDPRLEVVNMGVTSYGFDQMYLLYLRNGLYLEYDILIVALVSWDMCRYGDHFFDLAKPFLVIDNNSLLVKGVPVRNYLSFLGRVNRTRYHLERLASLRAIRWLFRKFSLPKSNSESMADYDREYLLTVKIMEDILRLKGPNKGSVVMLWLPTVEDILEIDSAQIKLKKRIKEALVKLGILFIDLTEDFKGKSLPELKKLFLFEYSGGTIRLHHFSLQGAAYIAELLYQRLLAEGLLS